MNKQGYETLFYSVKLVSAEKSPGQLTDLPGQETEAPANKSPAWTCPAAPNPEDESWVFYSPAWRSAHSRFPRM